MINLIGKSVVVETQEEYLRVLKMAKLQGFTWARANHLNAIDIPIPNVLNFYEGKTATWNNGYEPLLKASELVANEKKLEEAIKRARVFIENPNRTSLTGLLLCEPLKLLADTVESQLEEVK